MGMCKRITAALLLMLAYGADARPISYSGGYTLMLKSDSITDSALVHYSPTHKYSIGLEAVNDKFLNKNYLYARLTYLLGRKNTQNSQSNLYLQSGISSRELGHYFYGIQGDWETRRLFAGFNYKKIKTDAEDLTAQYLQFGVAPYLGDYGDLHTWLMIKTKKNTAADGWDTYPVLKLFWGSTLVEVGYSKQSKWDAMLVYRF